MLMYNLIELRKAEPSVREMLEQVHVMQQPSGYVDQVIMKWHLVRQGEQFPLSIVVRDLFTGAYCDASRLTMSTISQVPSWIWGKMTLMCQFTDTMAVFPFKRFLHAEQSQCRRETRAKHEAEGIELNFKCGYYGLLRMVARSLSKVTIS